MLLGAGEYKEEPDSQYYIDFALPMVREPLFQHLSLLYSLRLRVHCCHEATQKGGR